MKKLLAILLLATLAISICACGAASVELPENGDINSLISGNNNYDDYVNNDSNTITLTTDNIEDYVKIELSDANFDTHSSHGLMQYLSGDIVTNVYPVSSGSFENVVIALELSAPNKWFFLDKGSNYDETQNYPNTSEVEIFLRANGEGTYSCQIATDRYGDYVYNRIEIPSGYSYQIVSVSGTLIKN